LWGFVVAMVAAELYAAFGPDPASPQAAARTALFGYLAIAALAALVDWIRNSTQLAPNPRFNRLAAPPVSG
jgi:hypothetical protein